MSLPALIVLLSCSLVGFSHYILGTNQCHFNLGFREFNLCPILGVNSRRFEVERLNSTNFVRVAYKFSFNALSREPGPPAHEDDLQHCPPDTWICMITVDHYLPGPPKVLSGLPVASAPLLEIDTQNYATTDLNRTLGASLNIRLQGRSQGHQIQQALIQFYCDESATEPSSPLFSGENRGVHSFVWKSIHACAQDVSRAISLQAATADGSNDVPEGEESQDLMDPGVNVPRSRLFAILLLPAAALVMLGIAIYSPPAALRRWFSACVKPMRFRVGDIRLVEWAQMEQGVMEDEEDVMVNATEDADLPSEYIPLKPSPRRSILAHYGSTRRGNNT